MLYSKPVSKTSFLEEIAPEPYDLFRSIKIFALVYALILGIFFFLSLHFYNAFIKYFISIMMGWTIPSVLFIGAIIVILDKIVAVPKDNKLKTSIRYKLSIAWGITLFLIGITYLFLSSSYKHDYAFYCQDFYLEDSSNVFHIRKDCDYVGETVDGSSSPKSVHVTKTRGYKLRGEEYNLCIACKEWAEDAESEYGSSMFYRR